MPIKKNFPQPIVPQDDLAYELLARQEEASRYSKKQVWRRLEERPLPPVMPLNDIFHNINAGHANIQVGQVNVGGIPDPRAIFELPEDPF